MEFILIQTMSFLQILSIFLFLESESLFIYVGFFQVHLQSFFYCNPNNKVYSLNRELHCISLRIWKALFTSKWHQSFSACFNGGFSVTMTKPQK